jgi:hypothetical protein
VPRFDDREKTFMNPVRRTQRVAMAAAGLALLAGLTLNAGVAGAAVAPGLQAQAKTSLSDTNRDCGGVLLSPPTKTVGSATMNQTRAPANGRFSSNLAAGLTIQGATAGATYSIRLIQVDNNGNAVGASCETVVGTVTVDALGNGTAGASARVLPGATQWLVDLNTPVNGADYFDTDLVMIV